MPHLLFVYGTLKRSFPHHDRYLGGTEFIGQALTREPFPLVLNGPRYSPILIDAQGHGLRVQGELYRIDDHTLDDLDRLEQVNARDGCQRRRLTVTGPDNIAQAAWCYMKLPTWVEDVRSEPLAVYDDVRYQPRDESLD